MDTSSDLEGGEIHFTTLGMFIIDQILYGPSSDRKAVDDIIGGAGTYGIIGARLFSPYPLSRTLGWIVDAGSDFPLPVERHLASLRTHLVLRPTPERLTTRGWNSYGPGDHRAFKYLTPKKRLTGKDLIETGLGRARCVHMICSPLRAESLRDELYAFAGASDGSARNGPIVVWEPVPDLCTPQHRDQMLATAKLVDVISPNQDELTAFWAPEERGTLEDIVDLLLQSGVGRDGEGSVVVRAGKRGCLVATKRGGGVWLPAYYTAGEDGGNHPKVVDPTGGGNTFVGGLGVGLARSESVLYSAALGSVAASFAIEQIGIPTVGETEEGELWNGVKVQDRMDSYMVKVKQLGIDLNCCST